MKKLFVLYIFIFCLPLFLISCGNLNEPSDETDSEEQIPINNTYDVIIDNDGRIAWKKKEDTKYNQLFYAFEVYNSGVKYYLIDNKMTKFTYENGNFSWKFDSEKESYFITNVNKIDSSKLSYLYCIFNEEYKVKLTEKEISGLLNGEEIHGIKLLSISIDGLGIKVIFTDRVISSQKFLDLDMSKIITTSLSGEILFEGIKTKFTINDTISKYQIVLDNNINEYFQGQVIILPVLDDKNNAKFVGWYDQEGNKYTTVQVTKNLQLTSKYEDDLEKGAYINYYIDGKLQYKQFVLYNDLAYLMEIKYENEIINEWYSDSECSNKVNESSILFTDEINLYGKKKEPTHEHQICPICGLCTAINCDGTATEQCIGHNSSNITCAEDSTQSKCNDPITWDWNYNRSQFDGKKITIKIIDSSPELIDPFRIDFIGTQRFERQLQINDIELAYNIDLVIEKFPDEAYWGPDRIKWINDLAANNIKNKGDIFNITSSWIYKFVESNSIEILETLKFNENTGKYYQNGGFFTDFNYVQDERNNRIFSINNKVYGYSNTKYHADYFLYYNQDLVDKYALEDPATMWNEGRWNWSNFIAYLENAQAQFDNDSGGMYDFESMYAFGGWIPELGIGTLAARGGKMVDLDKVQVNFKNQEVIQVFEDLKTIKTAGMWSPYYGDVCVDFKAGLQLFQGGYLWYLSDGLRFANTDPMNPNCDFRISVVPYPTADGDEVLKNQYKIPISSATGYVIRKVSDDESIKAQILFNILDDFSRGLVPQLNTIEISEEEQYRTFLLKMIQSTASVDAIMSVETNLDKYGYFEYIDILSQAVGNGSHWQEEGFWAWTVSLFNQENDVTLSFSEHYEIYQSKLEEIMSL